MSPFRKGRGRRSRGCSPHSSPSCRRSPRCAPRSAGSAASPDRRRGPHPGPGPAPERDRDGRRERRGPSALPGAERRGACCQERVPSSERSRVFRPMSGLLDWWYRIRTVVRPPGTSATRAAVPADAGAATAAELAPVFAHVDRLEPELRERETAVRHECRRDPRGRRPAGRGHRRRRPRAHRSRARRRGGCPAARIRGARARARAPSRGRRRGGAPASRRVDPGARGRRARAGSDIRGGRRPCARADQRGMTMGAGWVAGSVRARLLARHRLGVGGRERDRGRHRRSSTGSADVVAVRAVGRRDHVGARHAAGRLDRGALGHSRPGGLAPARRRRGGPDVRRVLRDPELRGAARGARRRPRVALRPGRARDHVDASRHGDVGEPSSATQLRRSRWRDPGTDDPAGMLLGMRLEWARRLAGDRAGRGVGAGRGRARRRSVPSRSTTTRVEPRARAPDSRRSGGGSRDAVTLPGAGRRARRTRRGGSSKASSARTTSGARKRGGGGASIATASASCTRSRPGLDVVVGAFAVRMADAWRIAAALDIASRGGLGREVLDAVA